MFQVPIAELIVGSVRTTNLDQEIPNLDQDLMILEREIMDLDQDLMILEREIMDLDQDPTILEKGLKNLDEQIMCEMNQDLGLQISGTWIQNKEQIEMLVERDVGML